MFNPFFLIPAALNLMRAISVLILFGLIFHLIDPLDASAAFKALLSFYGLGCLLRWL